jgi:NitT/TauT family transport system substrate-binding protein
MAPKVRINTGGKIVMVLVGLALIAFAIWKFIPKKDADAEGVKPEFSKAENGDGDSQSGSAATDGKSTPGLGRPIKVAIVTWGGYAGGIMANNGFKPNKDSTFWKEYGIEVELKVIDDYPASRAAFKSGGDKGGVDIMWATVDSFALEYDTIKDLNPVTIMQYDWSRGGDAVAVSKEIQAVADLKNKRIAVAEGTPSHYFALYMLSQADLSTTDVNWVFTSSAIEAAQLFEQGKVDAAVSWSPDVYQAAEGRDGGHILASTKEATALIADVFVARGDFAKEHPDLVAKFVLGWLDGVDQVNKNPDPVYPLMVDGFEGIGMDDAKGMLGDVKLPSYSENLAFFEVTGDQLRGYPDIYQEAQKLWRTLGKTSGRTDPADTYDTQFLKAIRPEAEKRFGKVEEATATKEFDFDFKKEDEKKEAILTKRISVYFPTGSSELDENSKYILDDAASLAQTFGSTKMRVAGNTDNVGSRGANVALSKKRAQAVVDYMVQEHGFPADKFVVVGNGPDKPVADNSTKTGRKKNRRTDFEILR